MKKDGDLKSAESLGQIKTSPKADVTETDAVVSEVIDNPEEFRMAIGNCQLEGRNWVEVSERLFNYLIKNQKTAYITYGDPGIKVFKTGTRAGIAKEERMSAEEYADYAARKKMAEHADNH